jgi:hypothetical protein
MNFGGFIEDGELDGRLRYQLLKKESVSEGDENEDGCLLCSRAV